MTIKKFTFLLIIPIDIVLWYARIGIYYSISRNTFRNNKHFKVSFLNDKYAVPFTVFFQFFIIWIYCLDKFLQEFYLILDSLIGLFVKDAYWYFSRKLITVISMFIQSSYCKQMTLALKMFLIICNVVTETNPGRNGTLKFPFVTGI